MNRGKLAVVAFEDLVEGRSYGPFEFTIESELSDELRGAVGERIAGPTAPPGVFTIVALDAYSRALGGIPPGGILIRFEAEFLAAAPASCRVESTVTVGPKETKRGRGRAAFDIAVSAAGDRQRRLAAIRMSIVWPSVDEQRAAVS